MNNVTIQLILKFGAALIIPMIAIGAVVACGTSANKRSIRSKSVKSIAQQKSIRGSKNKRKSRMTKSKKTKSKKSPSVKSKSVKKSGKPKVSMKMLEDISLNCRPSTAQSKPIAQSQSQSTKSVKASSSVSTKDSVSAIPFGVDTLSVLKLSPASLRFGKSKPVHHISVTNQSSETIAVKVKCSDNKIYRVTPVYFFLEPNSYTKVTVRRDSKIFKVDKLAFAVIKMSKGMKNAARAFAKFKQTKDRAVNELTFVVPLFVDATTTSIGNLRSQKSAASTKTKA